MLKSIMPSPEGKGSEDISSCPRLEFHTSGLILCHPEQSLEPPELSQTLLLTLENINISRGLGWGRGKRPSTFLIMKGLNFQSEYFNPTSLIICLWFVCLFFNLKDKDRSRLNWRSRL